MKTDMQNIPDHLILFDGVCNFCNSSVQFVIKSDKKNKFYFAALQSETGQKILKENQLSPTHLDTVIYIQKNKIYTKSTAALQILKALGGIWPVLSVFIFVPRFIRDTVYDFISKRRYSLFGKRESCMIPTPEIRARFIG